MHEATSDFVLGSISGRSHHRSVISNVSSNSSDTEKTEEDANMEKFDLNKEKNNDIIEKIDGNLLDSNKNGSDNSPASSSNVKPASIPQLFRFSDKKDKIMLAIGTVFALAAGTVMPVMIIIFSNLMGVIMGYYGYVEGGNIDAANSLLNRESRKYCFWFLGLGLIMWVLSYGVNATWAIAAENQGMRIRKLYYSSIMRQDIGWFDVAKTGELTTRITNDINLIQEGIGEKFNFITMNVTTFVVSFIIAVVKGWDLTLICFCVVPFIVVVAGYFETLSTKIIMSSKTQNAESGAVADEVLSGIRTVMAFNGQEREIARYDKKIEATYQLGRKNSFALGLSAGLIDFFIYVMYSVGFHYGAWRVREGKYEPREILNVILVLLTGGFILAITAPNLSVIASAQGCAAKVFAIIDRVSEIDPLDTERGKKVDRIRGDISFRNIHFRYPARPNVKILKGFNLNIRAGQKVALVGESGCGKSTTIGLIERFYDPEQGDVLIDGVNIKEYNIGALRHHIGIVTQEPVLFSTTIYQNIVWGAIDPENNPPTEEEVIDACKAANAHQFISQLPNGYQTLVGESGALLSGGQKQRIAIARAIIRNPDILLLDEATSALDTASERLVQDALDKLSSNRTTISIAHRLSTIRNSDQIYVVRDGIVSENGTHDELVAMDGEYAAMVRAQELRKSIRTNSENAMEDDADVEDLIAKEIREQALDLKATTKQTILSHHSSAAPNTNKLKSLDDYSDLRLLFRLIWNHRSSMRTMIPGTISALVEGAVLPWFAYVFAKALMSLMIEDPVEMKKKSTFYANFFLVFAGIIMFSIGGRVGLFNIAGESLAKVLRHNTFVSYMRFEAGYFDDEDNGVGTLTARLASNAENVNRFIGVASGMFISTFSTVANAIGIAFMHDWKLALIIIACWPIQGGAQYLQAKAVWEAAIKMREAYEKTGQTAAETIRNIKTVATLRREETFINNFNKDIMKPHKVNIKSAIYSSFGFGFAQACGMFVDSLIFFAGCRFIINGWTTVDQTINALLAGMFAAMSIGMLSQLSSFISKGAVSARSICMTIERESAINGIDPTGNVPSKSFEGNVSFENIKFSYPIRPDTKILKGISFKALAGKSIALVGASGSGKSTSILLAQRLYDANSGTVEVEGLNVRNWDIMTLRNNMAIVGQEPILFNYSIGENILYGKPNATQQEIEEAAKEANIYNFIMNLPDGFSTSVGQKGGRLSGGQKQRVAIARALIRKPKLLLLDEATAALDSRSEKIVQKVLDKASKERTTMTVAHRLSTIQDCDMIIVFKNGRIVERGTHDELLAMKGNYFSLVQQQSLQVTH